MREGQPVYTVTQVNGYIKNLLDRDGLLSGVFVRGEISNYKSYPSGHHYFSMKDEGGALRCVMFRREASRLPPYFHMSGANILSKLRSSLWCRWTCLQRW